MEKENINPQESSKFGKSQTILGDEKHYAGIAGAFLDHSVSLEELFRGYVNCGITAFKTEGKMMPAAFLVCRDYEKEKYKIGIYPMPNPGPGAMEFHSKVLRKLIGEMKAAEQNTFKLIGIIIGIDSHMSVVPKEQVLDANGNLDHSKYVSPRNDPNAKDVLYFSLESAFGKHILAYEYITSADGSIVVQETPFMDEKVPYDPKVDKDSNFGFFFAERMNQN